MRQRRYRFVQPPYPEHISKEELNELPPAQFSGLIKVISSQEEVPAAIEVLRRSDALGIDTETKPCFTPNRRNEVALLQISTDEICYLFRLNKLGLCTAIIDLLQDEEILKIGLSLKDDRTALKRLAPFEAQGFVELQSLCLGYGIRDASLQKIYGIMFGEYMSKGQRMSNWESPTLSAAQQAYASLDAWACLRIYRELMSRTDPAPIQFALL